MAKITYTNKVALNENPEIANINKVTDDDMNEIKQVVNDNYNNTIQITDTEPTDSDNKIWIDTGEVGSAVSEITNEYSTSTGLGYSANYINGLVDLLQTNKTKAPTGRDCLLVNDDTVKGINIDYNPINAPSQNTMVMWKVFLTDNTTSDGYWTYIVLAITLDDHKMFMNAYHNAVNTWIGWQQF